jgi:hypothetical protein
MVALEQTRQTALKANLTIKHVQVPHTLAGAQNIGQPELFPFVQVDTQAALHYNENAGLAVLAHAEEHLPRLHLDLQ